MLIKQIDYKKYTDEEIIIIIRTGDYLAEEFLIKKYKNLIISKSNKYFISGGDKDDIIQEGMIGFYNSIRYYDHSKNITFFLFAELCISRQIITAINHSNRKKYIPLNFYTSLNKDSFDYEDSQNEEFINFLKNKELVDPIEILIDKEESNYIKNNIIISLSKLETKVLDLYLKGESYLDIGNVLNKNEKSIDNAIQRIRKKVQIILNNKNMLDVG